MSEFLLNQEHITQNLREGMVLLDFLRIEQQLTGTRQACREGDCGACLVLSGQLVNGIMHYQPVNSCLLPLGLVHGRHIVSIEGINTDQLNPVQQILVDQGAIQCGFCTSGLLMAITAFLINTPEPAYSLALDAVSGNLCRCTGYAGIKRALEQVCQSIDLSHSKPAERISDLIQGGILPAYFDYIPQRLAALPEQACTKERAAVNVAGGTDLFVQQSEQLVRQSLSFIGQPENIHIEQQQCIISATTRIETLRLSEQMQALYPQIVDDFKLICSMPIRQQATIGGNLVNASPIGDLSVFFLALDAELTLSSPSKKRNIALRNFFKSYKQVDLRADELIDEICFQCPEIPLRISFEKVSKRIHLDIASVNSAMSLSLHGNQFKQIHISVGGVAATPLYLHKTSAFLRDKKISVSLLQQALELAQTEISPLSDIRGSADYKRLLVRQLLIAHWLKLLPDYVSWEDFL